MLKTADRAANANFSSIYNQLENVAAEKITHQVVSDLPSKSLHCDFADGLSKFVNGYRTECRVEENSGDLYQSIINSGNSNTYRQAYFDCAEIMNNATCIRIEFDTKFGNRWQIGLADLNQRPGESTGSKYTSPGVAFYIGTSDGSKLSVNGSNTNVSITDIWMHVKAVMDFKTKTTKYVITNRETGVVMNSGTAAFRDPELTGITGIEVYTWYSGELCIDNIEITANYEAQNNVLYIIPDGKDTCKAYIYVDGKPLCIGPSAN